MSITVLGVNHRTAPLEVRERFAHERGEVPGSLERVLAAGARGGVLLSTCNRTEFYLSEPDEAVPEMSVAGRVDPIGSTFHFTSTSFDNHIVNNLFVNNEARGNDGAAIAVGVLEYSHPPTRFPLAVQAGGVVVHLANPEPSVRAPIDRHG